MKKGIKLFSFAMAVAILTACGGGGDSTTPTENSLDITISGTINGNGYAKNDVMHKIFNLFATPAYAIGLNSPDSILVVSSKGEDFDFYSIEADGSFSINTSELSNDLVMFVVNRVYKTVFGHLNLETLTSDTLDFIDSSKLSSSMDFGNIDSENNCTSSNDLYDITSFSGADLISSLELISRMDGGMLLYSNAFRNEDIQGLMSVRFSMPLDDINGTYLTLSTNVKEAYFDGLSPLFYLDSALGTNFSAVDLYPPSLIQYIDGLRSNGTTLLSADATTPIEIINLPAYNSGAGLTTVETVYVNSLPQGDWVLKNHSDDTVLGRFEFAGVEAFDANDKFKQIIPSVKMNTDSSGHLTSLSVKYYTQSTTGVLEEMTETEFNMLTSPNTANQVFSYVLANTQVSANFTRSSADTTDKIVTYTTSTQINTADIARLIYSYAIGQAKYQFFYE